MGLPSEWWWPVEKGQGLAGKAVCARCPVIGACLDDAVVRREHEGIWGGCGENMRRGFIRLRPKRPHADPGPVEGCTCGWCRALRRHMQTLLTGSQSKARPPVAIRNGRRARHGIRATQSKGCRCDACNWSATKLGQALARLAVDTADHWERWAETEEPYVLARMPADDAARGLIEAAVRPLLACLGVVTAWTSELEVGGGPRPAQLERALAKLAPAQLERAWAKLAA